MKVSAHIGSLAAAVPVVLADLTTPSAPAVAQGIPEEIQKRGTLCVGMSIFVPRAMRSRDGSLVGLETGVAGKVAEDMGVGTEFVPTAWSGIIPAVIAGKFDVIIGGSR